MILLLECNLPTARVVYNLARVAQSMRERSCGSGSGSHTRGLGCCHKGGIPYHITKLPIENKFNISAQNRLGEIIMGDTFFFSHITFILRVEVNFLW